MHFIALDTISPGEQLRLFHWTGTRENGKFVPIRYVRLGAYVYNNCW